MNFDFLHVTVCLLRARQFHSWNNTIYEDGLFDTTYLEEELRHLSEEDPPSWFRCGLFVLGPLWSCDDRYWCDWDEFSELSFFDRSRSFNLSLSRCFCLSSTSRSRFSLLTCSTKSFRLSRWWLSVDGFSLLKYKWMRKIKRKNKTHEDTPISLTFHFYVSQENFSDSPRASFPTSLRVSSSWSVEEMFQSWMSANKSKHIFYSGLLT